MDNRADKVERVFTEDGCQIIQWEPRSVGTSKRNIRETQKVKKQIDVPAIQLFVGWVLVMLFKSAVAFCIVIGAIDIAYWFFKHFIG